MSKIICDVCGTSYPDTSTQCPICGSVRPADPAAVSQAESGAESGYAYVKGGRFSKSNVKKRNKAAKTTVRDDDTSESGSRSVGLIILLVVLLVILACLVAFVVLFALGKLPGMHTPTAPVITEPSGPVSVPCTQITLEFDQITLEKPGDSFTLEVRQQPLNTTDEVFFASTDPAVASVDEQTGVITYVAEGQTTITVSCGDQVQQCQVICASTVTVIPPEEFRLSRTAISFEMEGFSWILYSGDIPMEMITWSSDDESVATVTDGVVVAVGEGQTTVYGEYMGNKQGCTITCDFSTSEGGNGGEETGTGDHGELHIYAVYFFNPNNYDDFTINISKDDTLTLMLCDANRNEVEASWSINEQPYATISGSRVKGIRKGGTAIVTATYNGRSYTCRIRIQ